MIRAEILRCKRNVVSHVVLVAVVLAIGDIIPKLVTRADILKCKRNVVSHVVLVAVVLAIGDINQQEHQ